MFTFRAKRKQAPLSRAAGSALPLLVVVAGLGLILSGCGGKPERVRLSGQVRFQDKPVKYGHIVFEPDASKGNRGPQGYAKIVDGKYDTNEAGTAPCPGFQVVSIEGYPELGGGADRKSRLVFNYRTTVEVPERATTKDFDVPASAARREAVTDLPPP